MTAAGPFMKFIGVIGRLQRRRHAPRTPRALRGGYASRTGPTILATLSGIEFPAPRRVVPADSGYLEGKPASCGWPVQRPAGAPASGTAVDAHFRFADREGGSTAVAGSAGP